MTLERLEVLLLQLRDAAADLDALMRDTQRSTLDSDLRTRMAVAMVLMIVSDLAGRIQTLSPELVATKPQVPWTEIRGLRNRLAHDYFNLNLDVLWVTATESVPALMQTLRDVIPPHNRS